MINALGGSSTSRTCRTSQIYCLKGLLLILYELDNGRLCDGRTDSGECKRGDPKGANTKGVSRYRYNSCDFDYCRSCNNSKASVTSTFADSPVLGSKATASSMLQIPEGHVTSVVLGRVSSFLLA